MKKPVGVIGSGSFGVAVSKLLMENVDVMLFTRRESVMNEINNNRYYKGLDTQGKITAVNDLAILGKSCDIIMPAIPSGSFRTVMKALAPHVGPEHIMIHVVKGLDISTVSNERLEKGDFSNEDIYSMSQVIRMETSVIRVGCMSGPNLAKEIMAGQPAATVIASEFEEVIRKGQDILSSSLFTVFGSYDLKGAEIAGAFKNIIAIGSGILGGLKMGKNMQSALITRGLSEMIHFGSAFGAEAKSFLGTAGVGDLIATATSESSRNYSFGMKLVEGGSTSQIISSIGEVVEGVRTLQIVHGLARKENVKLPITSMLYKTVHEGYDVEKAIKLLMTYNYADDVDFL